MRRYGITTFVSKTIWGNLPLTVHSPPLSDADGASSAHFFRPPLNLASAAASAVTAAAAMSSLYPEMRFSWEIKSVDALFCNGMTRVGDLSREAILQVGSFTMYTITFYK